MGGGREWAQEDREGPHGLQGCDDDSGCYFQHRHEGCEYWRCFEAEG